MTETRFTDNAQIAAMLDGIPSLGCVFCGSDCDVPDNVLAVRQHAGILEPIAVCGACSDFLIVVMPLFAAGLENATTSGED